MNQFKQKLNNAFKKKLLLFVTLCIVTSAISLFTTGILHNKYKSISTFSSTFKEINQSNQKIVRYQCIWECTFTKSCGWIVCGGWADRLKGIMAAYVWALLTNRKLEINIRHPCDLKNLLIPNEIDWYKSEEEIELEELNGLNITEIKAVSKPYWRDFVRKNDITTYLNESDIIVLKVNYDWLRYISKNEKLFDRIKQLGYKPSKFRMSYLFRSAYDKLFKLNDELQNDLNEFLRKAKPTKDTKLICLQYRVYYAGRGNTGLFWDFVKNTFINGTNTDYRLFITTDQEFVEKEAREVFGDDKIVSTKGLFVEMDTGPITPDNCTRIHKSLLDFSVLRYCDMAVISKSGFGILGMASREKPDENLYLFKTNDTHNKGGSFVKLNMEFDSYLI